MSQTIGRSRYQRRHHGPLAFWFLNHLLVEAELAFQIEEFKNRGFSGFFLHPRAGLLTPYGSEDWFHALDFCIRHAKKIGLEAWLYDEDPYPSGMAGGRVTLDHPEVRASYLHPTIMPIQQHGRQVLDLPQGQLIGAYLVQNHKITPIEKHAGLVRTDWEGIQLQHFSYYPPHTASGTPHWRAYTLNQHFRISLDVAERGGFLIAFTREYAKHQPWGEYADLLNPKAVQYFIESTHEDYLRRHGHEFGKSIPGIFTDEPRAVGDFPWSESLRPLFLSLTGHRLQDCLPHLVADVDDLSAFMRWAYREAISRAFKTAYIDQIETFCNRAGLAFVGHISPEEDPIAQAVYTPGLMSWIGGMTIPGADFIGSQIGDKNHPLLHVGQKLASSAAHTRGKTDVLCEAFAVVDWVQNTSWMGQTINWLYALGVNMLTIHGQFYSIDGPRKKEAPPSQFFQASYWEHFAALSAYVENLSRELTAGHHVAPIAVYYPAEDFMALSPSVAEHHTLSDSAVIESERLRDRLANVVDQLLVAGLDFDFVDADALSAGKVQDGKLHVQEEEYSVLLLPGRRLSTGPAACISTFAKQGLAVVGMDKTIGILGEKEWIPNQRTTLAHLTRDLSAICSPIFNANGRLIGHKRSTPQGISLFLTNNDTKMFHGEITVDFEGPYEIYDAQSGQAAPISEPLMLEIEPGRAILIQQMRHPKGKSLHRVPGDWRQLKDLSSEWKVRPLSDNCLLLSEFRMMTTSGTSLPTNENFVFGSLVDLVGSMSSDACVPGRVTSFWTIFQNRGYRGNLALVRDSQLGPPADSEISRNFRFFLNGTEIRDFRRTHRYDPCNQEAAVEGLLQEGSNVLIMEQTLPANWPLEKGLPFDGLRLFGDFSIDLPQGRGPALLSQRPKAYEIGAPATFQQLGHPYYGGLVSYGRDVKLLEVPTRLAIRFEELHESAEIFINGQSAGILWQPPHFLEVDADLWKTGKNTIEVRCSTSPANYLQGLGRPSGFCGSVSLLTV